MSDKDLPLLTPPKIHKRTVIAKSRMFEIETLELEFANGATRQYERMRGSGRGAVLVVPVTETREFLLIREYAAGTEQYELGFPKGLIDPGESALEAGNRELQEEVGFAASELTSLKQITLAPGYFAANMQLLLAQGLTPSQLEGDEPEPLVIVKWPIDEWRSLLDWSEFKEARSVTALMLAARHLGLWR
ncbi:ADP compounds hydrolase NudE [Neiella marina]|uniref:ADP compounds hydrolase NudE n=1 Tax=Neiella holothuriorum TaxID=2870530 RepID=A0ABS7EG03_9GAMM|nr:ADP compounds hydrolase NudE [Neiella holothuriorum]MBW8191268.1 ADP compounds hydrolase NudE [Neiella holothuriorum]